MAKKSQKEVRKDALTKIGMALLVILIIANTIQLARFGEIVERVDRYNQGVVDELGGFREDIIAFGTDMNEMRNFLLLPTRDYSFMDTDTEIETEEKAEGSSTEKAVYQFMGSFVEEQQAEKNYEAAQQRIVELQSNSTLKEELAAQELTIGPVEQNEASSSFKILAGRAALFAVIADKKENSFRVQSALGTKELGDNNTISELVSYIAANEEKVVATKEMIEARQAGITGLTNQEAVQDILTEKNITFEGAPEEDEEGYHYYFLNSEGTQLLTLDLLRDGTYELGDKTYDTEEQLVAALTEQLEKIDASTSLEKLIAERRSELEAIFSDSAFQELLTSNNLSIAAEPREEYNKLLYDVQDADGNIQFSFVIELSSGHFKVLKGDEEIDLYSLLLGSKKKP